MLLVEKTLELEKWPEVARRDQYLGKEPSGTVPVPRKEHVDGSGKS